MQTDDLPRTADGTVDWLAVTSEQCIRISLEAGVAKFSDLQKKRIANGGSIGIVFGRIANLGGNNLKFIKLGDRYVGCEPPVVSPEGSLDTLAQFGMDSDIAFYNYSGDLFFHQGGQNGPRTKTGGVARKGVFRCHTGNWLTTTYAAAAYGDDEAVNRATAVAAVEERLLLWHKQVRAQDTLNQAANQ